MTEALGQLDADEREVFARLLYRRERNATGDLAEEWGVDVRTIYRAKDRTLRKLARMLTGEARA
jgi:DNA-directed RNA polymerase specialized sigma24 family protein